MRGHKELGWGKKECCGWKEFEGAQTVFLAGGRIAGGPLSLDYLGKTPINTNKHNWPPFGGLLEASLGSRLLKLQLEGFLF